MLTTSTRTPFVGREPELAALTERLEAAARGAGGVVLVAGEAGIGKTRLVAELAGHAAGAGWTVLSGRANQEEGLPPYLPFVDALREYVHTASAAELRDRLGEGAADVALLLREVRARLPDLPAAASPALETERYRLFESLTNFLLAIARGTGVWDTGFENAKGQHPTPDTRHPSPVGLLLVLDDLHWADPSTLRLTLHLARRLAHQPVLVVATYRDTDVGREHPFTNVRADLLREPDCDQINLGGLDEAAVAQFVEQAAGVTSPDGLAATLYRETAGNPLFVGELVRLLRAEGRLTGPGTLTSWRLAAPQSVQQVIGRRLDHLSAACNDALTLAAFIGRDFNMLTLRHAAQDNPRLAGEGLLAALDEAEAARVIAVLPGVSGQYSFTHPLMRETLFRQVLTSRRVHLHRQVGEALEALHSTNAEPYLAELAHHFVQAAPAGDARKAAVYARRAGDYSMKLFAYEEAAQFYETALQTHALAGADDEPGRCDLLLALAGAQSRAGQITAAKETFKRTAQLARSLGLTGQLAQAALGYGGYRGVPGAVDLLLVDLLEEALAALGDRPSALRARVLARLAMELYHGDSRERRDALSRAAVHTARQTGDPAALAAALVGRHYALHEPENLAERTAAAAELVALAEAGGDREVALQGYYLRVIDLLELGDIEGVDRAIAAHERLGEELRQPLYRWRTDLLLAMRAMLAGRLAEAGERAGCALAIGQQAQIANTLPAYGTQALAHRAEVGGVEALEDPLRGLIAQYPGLPAYHGALAILYARLGRVVEGRAVLEHVAAADFVDFPRDDNFVAGLAGVAELCACLGDAARARLLYDLLLPFADRLIVLNAAISCFGPVSRTLGLLAATAGDWQAAERHFARALASCERLGARPMLARTSVNLAAMLLRRDALGDGEGTDRVRARALLNQAAGEAAAMGMVYLGAEAGTLLAQLGAGPSTSTVAPSSALPDGLSSREVEVLRLVAAGRTSREIADDLVLSRRTVDHHVANILSKISARRRADAAAYARRHGLT